MSVDISVFIPCGPLPTRDVWQAEIDRLPLPAYLDERFDPSSDMGFIPCLYNDAPAGFEFYLDEAEEFFEQIPDLREQTQNAALAATFAVHSSLRELMSALCAATALATISNGYLFDPQEEEGKALQTASKALEVTRKEMKEVKDQIKLEEPYEGLDDFWEGFEKYIVTRSKE